MITPLPLDDVTIAEPCKAKGKDGPTFILAKLKHEIPDV